MFLFLRSATYNGKKIAVKIITRDHLSVDFESRFLPREISILSKINHENIIHVYKIFSYPKRVYIFMELVERGDLLCYIRVSLRNSQINRQVDTNIAGRGMRTYSFNVLNNEAL